MSIKDQDIAYEAYTNSIHSWGRSGLIIALTMLLAAPFIFSFITGASIQWDGFIRASAAVVIIKLTTSNVEYNIKVTQRGPGASNIAVKTPNRKKHKKPGAIKPRLPCAFNARETAKAEVGSRENEIISTLSVAASSLVTMIVIFIGVLLLIPLTPVLNNPVLKPAFDNVIPALFGALAWQYFRKSWRLTIIPLAFMTVLCILVPSMVNSTSFLIIACGGISIGCGYVFYRKGWIRQEEKRNEA